MKPPQFSCDPRDFDAFQPDFQEIVAKHRPDLQAQRYTMINECLLKEAKNLVMNLPSIESIWDRLKEKYGQTRDIISIVLRDITSLPEKNEDPQQSLIDLVDKIERGMADLKTVDALPQLTNEVVLSRIEARLSNRLKMKWFDDQDSLPGDDNFSCMWQFLQRERKSALSFVRLRKEEMEDKPNKPKKGRGAAHNVRSRAESSSSNQGTSSKKISESDHCFLHPDGNHFTRQCRKFLAMTVNERGKSLQENKACKFCLSAKAHSVTSWTPCPRESQWSPCQENNCGKNHSRLLHGCSVAGICNLTSIKPGATQPDSLLLYQEVPTPAD